MSTCSLSANKNQVGQEIHKTVNSRHYHNTITTTKKFTKKTSLLEFSIHFPGFGEPKLLWLLKFLLLCLFLGDLKPLPAAGIDLNAWEVVYEFLATSLILQPSSIFVKILVLTFESGVVEGFSKVFQSVWGSKMEMMWFTTSPKSTWTILRFYLKLETHPTSQNPTTSPFPLGSLRSMEDAHMIHAKIPTSCRDWKLDVTKESKTSQLINLVIKQATKELDFDCWKTLIPAHKTQPDRCILRRYGFAGAAACSLCPAWLKAPRSKGSYGLLAVWLIYKRI